VTRKQNEGSAGLQWTVSQQGYNLGNCVGSREPAALQWQDGDWREHEDNRRRHDDDRQR
jgi:hypothetical protein